MPIRQEKTYGYKVFSKKELLKDKKELLGLHKRVVLTYLLQKDLSYNRRKEFFWLYDQEITPHNIEKYFFLPIRLFVRKFLLKELEP